MLLRGDPVQHGIVGGGPDIVVLAFGRFLAGDAQGAMLVGVEHVPSPGNRRLPLHHLGGEIAAHVIDSRGSRAT